MSTTTPNYSFIVPTDGADDDVWGVALAGDWNSIDTILKTIEDKADAAQAAADARKTPIGGLYFSGDDVDPATTLGYGTWAAHAEGRAILGAGDNGLGGTAWAVDDERGAETHVLSASEAKAQAHGHTADAVGDHAHGTGTDLSVLNGTIQTGGGSTTIWIAGGAEDTTGPGGAHTPQIDASSNQTNNAHTIVQPTVAVYVYKRLT
jgi:hypothetical protein